MRGHGSPFARYQIERLVHGHQVRSETRVHNPSDPKALLRRFHFDSLVFEPEAARYLIDLAGGDRIAIGTEAPFDMAHQIRRGRSRGSHD